jgi:hypothetical protein
MCRGPGALADICHRVVGDGVRDSCSDGREVELQEPGAVPQVPVHIEPFGLYSTWFAGVDALPEYAEVVLPSDSVNVDRSLTMLHDLGVIDCAPGPGELATVRDVRANPRNLVFKELTSWLLGNVREDFDAVFLFGNQAMEWGVDIGSALVEVGNAPSAQRRDGLLIDHAHRHVHVDGVPVRLAYREFELSATWPGAPVQSCHGRNWCGRSGTTRPLRLRVSRCGRWTLTSAGFASNSGATKRF